MTTSYGDPILARGGVDTALVASDGAVAEAPVVGPPLGSAVVRNSFLTIAPFVLSDMISLALAGLGAHAVLGWLYPEVAASAASLAVVSLFPLLLGYWLSGIYSEIWIHPAIEFRQLTHVSTMAMIAVMTVGIVAPPLAVWASVAWMSSVVIVPLLRTIARACCVKRKWWGYPTLIICSSDGADNVARLVLDCPRSGLRPVLMTDPHGNFRSDKLRVVNDPAALASQIATHGVRHAVVSLPDYSFNRLSVVLDRYSNLVPHLLVLSDAATLPTLWGASRSGGRLSGIEVRNGLLLATLQSVKRVFDIVASAGALVVGLPLFLGIALLIKVSSRGPVLFGHRRIGRHGRPFTAWKFRTMTSTATRSCVPTWNVSRRRASSGSAIASCATIRASRGWAGSFGAPASMSCRRSGTCCAAR